MAERNPSPPYLSAEEIRLIHSDSIGDTVFSKKWVLGTLMKLVESIKNEENAEENNESEGPQNAEAPVESRVEFVPVPVDEFFDNELCELWDMSMNTDVGIFLQEVDATEILLDVILKSRRTRITEICVGILGNMACCHQVCLDMMKNNELLDIVTALLDDPETSILVETARMIHVCVSNNDVKQKWISALKKCSAFRNFVFILENSLNVDLLTNCAHVVDNVLDCSDDLLQSWSDSELVMAVCEAMKQIRSEQIKVVEALLHILQLVSTVEKGVQALVCCPSVIPLLCHFIAECGHDEGGIIVGRELSLTASFSVLNVVLMAEPIAVLTAMEKDPRIMKILMGLLGYSCKIHRKRTKSSIRISFAEDDNNATQAEKKAVHQTAESQPSNKDKNEGCSANDDRKVEGECVTGNAVSTADNTNKNADADVRHARISIDAKEHDGHSIERVESDIHHQYFTAAIGLLKDIISQSSLAPKCVSSMLAPHVKMLEKIVHYARRINTYRDAIQELVESTLSLQELSSLRTTLERDVSTPQK